MVISSRQAMLSWRKAAWKSKSRFAPESSDAKSPVVTRSGQLQFTIPGNIGEIQAIRNIG